MKRKRQKGQGLVEFALILPILLLVIVGTMEFGRIFLLFATVSNGAREGARYGMVNPTDKGGPVGRKTVENIVLPAEMEGQKRSQ